MDPQTQQVIAVIAAIGILGAIAIAVWNWRLMRSAARRRFNPRNRPIDRSEREDNDDDRRCNCKRGTGCNCPDPVGPMCVAAKVNVRDDVPYAIYGLSSDECCSDGRLTARQVQQLVNRHEKLRQRKQDADLNALLASLAQSETL